MSLYPWQVSTIFHYRSIIRSLTYVRRPRQSWFYWLCKCTHWRLPVTVRLLLCFYTSTSAYCILDYTCSYPISFYRIKIPFYRSSLTIIYSSYLPGLFDTLFIPPAVLQALFTVCSIVWSIGVPVKGFVLRWTVKSISCWSAGESSLISERYIGKYLK